MAKQKKWVLQLYEDQHGCPHLYAPDRNDMSPPKPFTPTPGRYYGWSRYNSRNALATPPPCKILHVFEDAKFQGVVEFVSDSSTPEGVRGGTWIIHYCSIPQLDGLLGGVSKTFLINAVKTQVLDKGRFRADFKFRRYKYGRIIIELDE